jgi:hypothetical protein
MASWLDEDPQVAEFLRRYQLSQEQERALKMQKLSDFGFGMMGARKGQELQAVGRAGLLAGEGYRRNRESAQQENMSRLQMTQFAQRMAEQERQRKAADEFKARVAQTIGSPNLSAMGAGGPTPQNAEAAQSPNWGGLSALYAGEGQPENAKRYHDMAQSGRRQLDKQVPYVHNGKRVLVNVYKDGKYEIVPDLEPDKEKLHFTNAGGRAGVGQDPYTGAEVAPGVPVTMDPAQIAGDQVARANLGLRAEQNRIAADANSAMREVGGGQAQVKIGELSAAIRKEYSGLQPVQNYRAAAPIAASAANAPDTPAGDLDLIYAVGKVLDPGSVVREGEMQLVIKSGTPMQRFQGIARMIGAGKGRLPPGQRQQLVDMLNGRMGELKRDHDRAAAPYVRQAEAMKLPMDQIFQEEAKSGLSPAEAKELDDLRKRFGR